MRRWRVASGITTALRNDVQDVVLEYIRTAYLAASERQRTEPVITGRDVLGYLRQHALDSRLTLTCTRTERQRLVNGVLRRLVRLELLETSLASGLTGAEVRAYNPRTK
jgi:hypothetical protein